MTKEELAELLNGNEYREEISDELHKQAKDSDLLVIYGGSDDLLYLAGVGNDEIGCYDGGEVILRIGDNALYEDKSVRVEAYMRDEIEDLEYVEDQIDYLTNYKNGNVVNAEWCEVDGYSWTYSTDLPHATFDIMEDDDKYCRGIVIDINDLK